MLRDFFFLFMGLSSAFFVAAVFSAVQMHASVAWCARDADFLRMLCHNGWVQLQVAQFGALAGFLLACVAILLALVPHTSIWVLPIIAIVLLASRFISDIVFYKTFYLHGGFGGSFSKKTYDPIDLSLVLTEYALRAEHDPSPAESRELQPADQV